MTKHLAPATAAGHRIAARFAAPGFVATDHVFTVPLDHVDPNGATLEVFARELVAPSKADADLPTLAFLQGGPGGASPRPARVSGWLARALQEYRVLLLDQRGTGRSTPATAQTLAQLPSPAAQAAYLGHFRADAIVADAEVIRRTLLPPDRPWSILGQSYGGYCAMTYLSEAPEGLTEVFLTGGLANIYATAEDVYRATFERLRARNRAYLARYPDDDTGWTAVAEHVEDHDIRLPDGERLTVEQLQYLGMALGSSDGFERLHYLLDEAWVTVAGGLQLSDTFTQEIYRSSGIRTNPLFALLHEPLYAQERATRWAAARVLAEKPGFAYRRGEPFRFLGEMILPWMFDQYPALRPLREAAELLAARSDWPALYDAEQLAHNTIPVAAAVYSDDMYVDHDLSMQMAREIPGIRAWVTNEHQHDGLRADGDVILDRLIGMARGEI